MHSKDTGNLTVGRKLNEKVLIGDDIEVQVVEIQGNRVRLRISAPKSMAIVRSELLEQCNKVPQL